MVEFVYGLPGSGKTSYIMSRLAIDAKAGRRAFLIVPEQATVDVEGELAAALPPSAQLTVEALNFSRLANRVFRERGGLVSNYADKSRKLLFMWRALRECAPFLSEYGTRGADAALPAAMLDSVKEFKISSVTPEELSDAARRISSSGGSGRTLGAKLGDIAIVYSAYSALLGRSFSDSDDDLSRLAAKLGEEPYFGGASVYIDSFSSFTGQEHKIINFIMRQADEAVITLPLRSPHDRSLSAFSSRECSDRLRRDASGLGISPHTVCLGDDLRAGNAELRALARHFAEEETAGDIPENERGHVELYSCADPYSECEAAAARVRGLMMSGYRCRDIAIVARDAEKYRGMIDCALEKLDIPYFLSEKTGFSTRPLARLILSALGIKAYGWRREDVIAHLKTGLCGIGAREVDIFEAYTEKWNINGRAYYAEEGFSMNPDGYVAGMSPRGAAVLETANAVRALLRDRLGALFASMDAATDTSGICRAIWEYLTALDVRGTLAALSARELAEGRRREAEENSRLIDSAADALECICDVFEEKPDTAALSSALRLAFDAAEIGTIPTGCDEVMIGSADLLRAGKRKCVLVIGLCEGEFPMASARGGLLTDRDRAALKSYDIPLSATAESDAADELFYILRTFSTPSDRICLFTHETDATGSSCRPSTAFLRTAALFPYINVTADKDISPLDRIWSRRTALEYLPLCLGSSAGDALREYFATDSGFRDAEKKAMTPLDARTEALPPALARETFGERIELTQSKIESFVSCPCAFYLKNVLKLDDGARAEFGFAGMGTFIHLVLEKFLLATVRDGNAAEPSPERSAQLINDIVNDYIGSLGRSADTPRVRHLTNRLAAVAGLLISDIFAEFSGGSFRPMAYEVPIGMRGGRGIPAPEFPLTGGGVAVLRGIADRVDVAGDRESGKRLIRVVDYKTGSKEFSLDDVRQGLELQLPIYLYALTRGASRRDDTVPAALTYLSANIPTVSLDRPRTTDEIKAAAARSIHRSGLAVEDDSVLDALNRDRDPHFMQGAAYLRDGTPSPALISRDGMERLFDELEDTVRGIAEGMRSGRACAIPVAGSDGRDPCEYCRYGAVCRARIKA